MDYYSKYLKYKSKYLELKKIVGGTNPQYIYTKCKKDGQVYITDNDSLNKCTHIMSRDENKNEDVIIITCNKFDTGNRTLIKPTNNIADYDESCKKHIFNKKLKIIIY